MCMLTIEDSKHDVGDNKDASSEVAERKMCHESQST